jgi:hypothetical protein
VHWRQNTIVLPLLTIGLLRTGNGRPISLPRAIFRTTACIRAPDGTVEEPIFDEPQALISDHSLAGQLSRSTALGPVKIMLGIITFATAFGDGAANQWLTLVLVDNRGVPVVGALRLRV